MKIQHIILVACLVLITSFQNCSKGVEFSTQQDSNAGLGDPSYRRVLDNIKVDDADVPVDVLFVVDNSRSMAYEHTNIAARFTNFINKLQGLNWHLGIITTDIDEYPSSSAAYYGSNGRLMRFNPTTFFLTSAMSAATAEALFSDTIQMDANGDGAEQGLAATSRFIYRFLDASDAANANHRAMIRDNAALSVVLVSDADESPCGNFYGDRCKPSKFRAENLESELLSLVANGLGAEKKFVFNSIIVKPGDTACRNLANSGNEYYGTHYKNLSDLTGGVVGSVCETDYSSQLTSIGENTAELVKTLLLKCDPVDRDLDGQLDITLKTSNGIDIAYASLQGRLLKLVNALPIGQYKLEYWCNKL